MSKSCYFFATDGNYFPYACLAALRVAAVSDPIDGFILQMGVSHSDIETARKLLGGRITFIDVSTYLSDFAANNGRLGLSTYIRLFADQLPEFASYDHIVYADSDVLFNRSITDLANTDLKAPLLAAHDIPSYFDMTYRRRLPLRPGAPKFNAGVLMFNMSLVRSGGLLASSRQFAVDHPDMCQAFDQDALNVVFEGQWQTMHPAWNVMTNFSGQIPFHQAYARHFSWGKPWSDKPLGVEPEALAIYREMARATPWSSRFDRPASHLDNFIKRLGRKFDPLVSLLTHDEKLKRRSRFDAAKTNDLFASHADQELLAVQYPEKAAGYV
ncbi:glycosyltransferase [Mesorhizobium sp. dw_380]|uniref:glycosyltransferase family 8 protein n=1 Tax=Mesorhizobium sp. dw_380 TaxID=2812001 RepID=UPI001BDE870C|nr:glycosyltransferase [Mesorhizobium sp. dw_380]